MLPTVKEPELDERRGLQEKTEEKHKLKKKKGMDKQMQTKTENWRRTSRRSSERMIDSFTDDLGMIYPGICFRLSEHQRPLTSERVVCGDRVEP